jgi:hypothetical protein
LRRRDRFPEGGFEEARSQIEAARSVYRRLLQ